jgi:hypothetical protein
MGLVLLIPFFAASTVLSAEDGAIVQRSAYNFPAYEQAVQITDVEKYTDRVSYENAINDTKFEFEKVRYVIDGLKVVALPSLKSFRSLLLKTDRSKRRRLMR